MKTGAIISSETALLIFNFLIDLNLICKSKDNACQMCDRGMHTWSSDEISGNLEIPSRFIINLKIILHMGVGD